MANQKKAPISCYRCRFKVNLKMYVAARFAKKTGDERSYVDAFFHLRCFIELVYVDRVSVYSEAFPRCRAALMNGKKELENVQPSTAAQQKLREDLLEELRHDEPDLVESLLAEDSEDTNDAE